MGCNNSKNATSSQTSTNGELNVANSGPNAQKKNNVYKILMIGDASVGFVLLTILTHVLTLSSYAHVFRKTSLSARWVDNNFADNYIATIGVDFKVKTINGDRIQVWDTGM